MKLRRFLAAPRPLRSVCVFLLPGALSAASLGCNTYEGLEPTERHDSGTPRNDGQVPTADARGADNASPPSDAEAGTDVASDGNVVTDAPRPDAVGDVTTEVTPPTDAPPRDVAIDAQVPDVVADAPPADAPPRTDARDAADTSVPPGPDASADAGAPDVIDAGAPDADASPPADADAGTTIDVRDSGPTCWGGPPSTNDEDNDGIVDECDNCPSVANANQADTGEVNSGGTADGVGDACDPRPTLGGDSLYLFDGLNFTSLPATWSNVGGGTWTYSGSSVTPNVNTGQELTRSFPSAIGNYLAETAFTMVELTTSGSASLPLRMDGSRNGLRCALGTPDGITGQLLIGDVTAGTTTGTPLTTPTSLPGVGNRYRLYAGAYGTDVFCYTSTGVRLDATKTSTTGESGLRAIGARATFEYLMIYRLGGTVP